MAGENNTAVETANAGSNVPQNEQQLQREVTCICEGGERVPVRASLLFQCGLFTEMCKASDMTTDSTFDVKTISVGIFKKIADWMQKHVGEPVPEFEEDSNSHERKWFVLTDYEKEFFNIDVEMLSELLTASNFLNLQSLYRHACQAMAAKIKDLTPDQIRDLLGIEDDLTEEQKIDIRRKNVWCNY